MTKLEDIPYPLSLCIEMMHYAAFVSEETKDMRADELKQHMRVFFSDALIAEAVGTLSGHKLEQRQEQQP